MASENPVRKRPVGLMANGIGLRAIVVDDEFSHRRIVVQTLKSAGFDVVGEGVNGEEAIRLVGQYEPKFVFLDYHMPRMDGLEALKTIHKSHPDVKVVMCTTDNEKERVLELLSAGASEYVIKPVDRKVMLQKLEKLVGQ